MSCCSGTSSQTGGCKGFSTTLLVGSLIGARYYFLDWHPIRLGVSGLVLSVLLLPCDLEYSAFIGVGGVFAGKAIRDLLPFIKATQTATSIATYLSPVTKGTLGIVSLGYGLQAAYKQAFID